MAEPLVDMVSFITGTYWLDMHNDAQTFPGAPRMIPWPVLILSPSFGALSGLWPIETTAEPLADLVSFTTGTYWLDTNNNAHTFPGAPTMILWPVPFPWRIEWALAT